MGTLIIPPGYTQVLIPFKHSAFSRAAAITMGVVNNDTPDATDLNALLNAWDDAMGGFIDDSVTMGPAVGRVGQDGGVALTVLGTATEIGSQAGSTALNQGQALLVHKNTGVGGRRGRGRMYVPWLVQEGNVDDVGGIASASLTSYNTALAAFVAAVVALDTWGSLVVLHSTGESALIDPTPIVSMTADPVIGAQRRRLGR